MIQVRMSMTRTHASAVPAAIRGLASRAVAPALAVRGDQSPVGTTVAASTTARADIGLGLFVGEPLGLDLKLGIGPRSGLDIVLGASSYRRGRTDYAHVTYLLTPFVGHGDSVLIPLRLGVGGAVFG